MKKNVAIALLMIAIAAGGYLLRMYLQVPEEPPVTGSVVEAKIDFTLDDLHGKPRSLSEWRGTPLLVNFWATWCAPCRREIPLLKATQAEHAVNRLQVVGVAVDYREQVEQYAKDAEFNYPILIGQEDAMAAAEASGIEFVGMPFTLVVASDGSLVNAHIGEIVAEHIEQIVSVMGRLESGEMDLATARMALKDL
ncbi:MAG TPA: TlpA disulfide reductase family protein [Woeseiaceae bacterium]|nr:TlpA disulfide reductase family protein [Woeseiaceae bacterium]